MNKHLFSSFFAACRRRLDRRRRSTVVGCGAFIIFILFSSNSFAEDYYWRIESTSTDRYPSALSACVAAVDNVPTSNGYWRYSGMTKVTDTRYTCLGNRYSNGSSTPNIVNSNRVQVYRFGDSCPPDHTLNTTDPAKPTCLPPEKDCSAENGSPILTRGSNGPVIESGGRRYVSSSPPSSACVDSCTYVADSSASTSCYFVPGSTDTGFCNYILKGNGQSCSGWDWDAPETGDPLNSPDTPDVPPSDPDDPGCDRIPGYVWSGTTCVPENPDGGDDGDGEGDGEGDGSGDGGGSGDGDGGGEGDGDGSGDGDGNGDGNGTGDGDGSGDGNGECDPSKDPSCAPGSVSGPGCDQPLVCTGDVVSCAILKQQKDMRCHAEEQADYESKKTDIDSLFQGDKFEIDEQNVDVPSFVDRATTFLPRTCPVDQRISVSSGSISMSYEPLCVLAEGFSWIFVAFTTVFCAIYVGAAFGGNE